MDPNNNEVKEEEQDPTPPPSLETVLNYLQEVQKAVLCDQKLFDLAEQLTQGVQVLKVQAELHTKAKQASITNFFQKC